MSNLILFDIDKTLIDSHKLANEMFKPALSQHLQLDHQEFLKTAQEYWDQLEVSTDFNPEEFILFLVERYGGDPQALLNVIFAPELYRQCVYPDVMPVLNKLSTTYVLGIFSQGNEVYQQQKLELSGLKPYFKDDFIFILHRKLDAHTLEKLPEAVIVDDKPEVVQTLSNFPQFLPIWINRIDASRVPGTATIHSLNELETVL